MRFAMSFLAVAVAVVISSGAEAQDKDLTFITGNDFKPFTDEGLPGGGMITEIIRQVLEERGYNVDFEFSDTWTPVYDAAARGEYAGTFPYYYRVRRARDFAYSDPIFVETQWIFHLKSNFSPSSDDDLLNRTMCYPQGYAIPPRLVDHVKGGRLKHEAPNTMARCFELLALKRVDFVVSGRLQGFQLVTSTPDLERDAVGVSDFTVAENGHHLIVAHDFPNRQTILDSFNTGLRLLKVDGRFAEIVEQYLPGWDEQPPPGRNSREGVTSAYNVTLPSGRQFEAKVTEVDQGRFRLQTSVGDIVLNYNEIQKFEEIEDKSKATTASTTASATGPSDLQLSGVTSVGSSLVPALAKAFAAAGGGAAGDWQIADDNTAMMAISGHQQNLTQVAVRTASAADAMRDLVTGSSHVAMSDRQILPAESRRARQANLGDLQSETAEKVIALQAGAVIVHPDNPVGELSCEQIRQVFTGGIRDWSTLGGSSGTIDVIVPEGVIASGVLLRESVLDGRDPLSAARVVDNAEAVSRAVAGSPSAIGFAPVSRAGGTRQVNITRCGVLLAPTSFQVKTEEYPFVQRLFLYAPPQTDNRYVGPFVSFAESGDGQAIVAREGFVDLRPSRQTTSDFDLHRQRLALMTGPDAVGVNDYLGTVRGSGRLSISFRFRTGRSELDARALRDVRRLAGYLRENGRGADVSLVGFADARGTDAVNLELSRDRATSVRDALKAELPDIRFGTVTGYGEAMPVACNDAEEGWELNRRVEVWLRG